MARKKKDVEKKKTGLTVVDGGKKDAPKKSAKAKNLVDGKDTAVEKKRGRKPKPQFEASAVVPHDGTECHGDLRQLVMDAKTTVDTARWDLAESLYDVHDVAAFSHWGFPSWDAYVENEVGIVLRTAQYLTAMYHYFTTDLIADVKDLKKDDPKRIEAEKIQAHIVKQVRALGWTKAKSLVSVVNRENYEEWLTKAKSMTSQELIQATKAFLKGAGSTDGDSEKFKRWSALLAPPQYDNVQGAVKTAGGITGSDKPGNCLDLICQDFIAGNMSLKPGDRSFTSYLNQKGAQLGIRLIAVDKETGKVVHGDKLFTEMTAQEKAK